MKPAELKSIRTQLKLTQKKLAKKIGVKRCSTISDWETGKKPIPETVAKLAAYILIDQKPPAMQNETSLLAAP